MIRVFINFFCLAETMAIEKRIGARASGKTGCDNVPEKAKRLEKWLLGPDPGERLAAIKEIRKAKSPEKKAFLMRSLMHDDQKIRKMVSSILGEMKEEVTNEDIINMDVFLNSPDPGIRFDIINTMSKILSVDSADTVSEILSAHVDREDDRKCIRLAVKMLWSIESVNDKNRSFEELIDFLNYDNQAVQEATIHAIGKYSNLLTTEEISMIADLLDEGDREKQVLGLEALKFVDRPVELASSLMKFFDNMEERDKSTILLALEVLGGMRRYEPIEDFLVGINKSSEPKYEEYKEFIEDLLCDTMRLTPYLPKDAIVRKEQVEAAEQDLFFQIMAEENAVKNA